MKIGILARRAAPVALLQQLVASHDSRVYADCDAALLADDLALWLIDLEAVRDDAGRAIELVGRGNCAVLLLAGAADVTLLQALRAAGADDFVMEPIRRGELALRLGLLLRQADPHDEGAAPLQLAEFHFDLQSLRVRRSAAPLLDVALTRKEAELAMLLLQHLGRPLSRTFIQERIWGAEPELPTRTIDTHISRVRNKLSLKPEHGYRLATVYGYGYQLERLAQV